MFGVKQVAERNTEYKRQIDAYRLYGSHLADASTMTLLSPVLG